jgi:CRP/FNR family cyclic AMP-dependent transcriptional regulator
MSSAVIEHVGVAELGRHPLFGGVPPDELAALAELVRRAIVPPGTILISALMPRDAIYFILSGSVKVHLQRESGSEIILALLGPGDLVGEMSIVPGHGRSVHAVTRQETTLLWMERSAFERALEVAPAFCRNLVSELVARLRAAQDRFQALATLDVTGRVARQLLELAERYGRAVPGEGIHVDFPVTQGEIAELIAATRERVNQILMRLRRAGVISTDAESRLLVHRPEALAELCRR